MASKVEGIAELRKKLQTIAREVSGPPGSDVEQAMKRSVYRVVFTVADYPTQQPSAYRRTGTLGRRWFSKVTINRAGGAITGQASNNTVYAPFVQSHLFQRAEMKRRGWITERQALEKNMPAIEKEFAGTIARIVARG